ncbi:expressed unknown protein [Seminavis robusta]|uniref:Nucleotide-diphospho-sugar transferase domain-containing protein n=1 Tax=Seminavis robusta TaxID=568900 RepID=A0A9N8HRA3_9STRA|nr:expressed unknown protein [Seminavis robusta]|eukprot:Sro1249_g256010.1 n/a (442) ;mRNA; f:16733-18058
MPKSNHHAKNVSTKKEQKGKSVYRAVIGIVVVGAVLVSFSRQTLVIIATQGRHLMLKTSSQSPPSSSPLSSSTKHKNNDNKRPRIAILSNYVTKQERANEKLDPSFYPHLINKACYADFWGYDFIFNQTWAFPDHIRSRHDTSPDAPQCALDWGHLHRVPQLLALLDSDENYDWILWTDMDYIFTDLAVPLESILAELQLHRLNNVHVIVPDDGHHDDNRRQFVFSSFTVMIRNSHFGRSLLHNWMNFLTQGLCPKGNFQGLDGCRKYKWIHGDQPGLWYALAKTYSDLMVTSSNKDDQFTTQCNNQTGYLVPEISGFPGFPLHMGAYFSRRGLVKSANYSEIPKDQPIVWSYTQPNKRSGIGVNANEIVKAQSKGREAPSIYQSTDGLFAVHVKSNLLPPSVHETNRNYCMAAPINCRIGYDDHDEFALSCHNRSVVHGP